MAVTWEQPKPMDKWINKMWLDLEDTQLSGRSQALVDNRARFPVWEFRATPLPGRPSQHDGETPSSCSHMAFLCRSHRCLRHLYAGGTAAGPASARTAEQKSPRG